MTESARPRKRSPSKLIGLALIVTGGLLLTASVGYFVLSSIAKAQLGNLEKTVAPGTQDTAAPPGWEPATTPTETGARPKYFTSELPSDSQISFLLDASRGSTQVSPIIDEAQTKPASTPTPSQPTPKPGGSAPPLTGPIEPSALQLVDSSLLPKGVGFKPPATRILIPDIGLDSRVTYLRTVVEDNILVWETPKWSVGHMSGTANPGEAGNVVITGHISSPIRGEGAVFKRLPEIPKLLDFGWKVDIILYTAEEKYLYRVTSTKVVAPDQVDIMATTQDPVLTLITCVPDGVYSHRLIVTAKLMYKAPLEQTPLPCAADNPYCGEPKQ